MLRASQGSVVGRAMEVQRQAGYDEGREEDRQKGLAGGSKRDRLAVSGLEGSSPAGVSTATDLQRVASGLDWNLRRLVHVDRSSSPAVDQDVVGPPPDLGSDRLVGQLQRRGHV